ncbi:protein TPX2-like isoform X1 [Cucurbita pepo subsp. pepo]|uniref:protein TPX2-like isoform X1 n=1 Tax=Cucurbita pepo subsp. pepo TaxID=3664 RepID=UPI000C9D4EF7|nr:protein TPX2-like isoform X1 [Cucurbita pepo subsp. pepo]
MDEEMEIEPVVFDAYEVDIEYEFDAARYFDFTREESFVEACEAELWFQSAESYPPSPFVAKLFLREECLFAIENASKKSEGRDSTIDSHNDDNQEIGSVRENDGDYLVDCQDATRGFFTNSRDGNVQKIHNQQLQFTSGSKSYNRPSLNIPKVKAPSCVKPSRPRGTTLMKPTVSHLARQTQHTDIKLQRVLVKNNETSVCSSGTESQAIKKQKLDEGHSRKVNEIKQQTSLVHKLPKKDGVADKSTTNAKLKITIPRQPDLETAHRAHRIRLKSKMEEDNEVTTTRRFRARPLNRKILEAPSLPLPKKSTPKLPEFQEFHLRTLERAMQNTSAVSSSAFHHDYSDITVTRNMESRRSNAIDDKKNDEFHVMQNFKACPLNRKMFSSKGEIGVFRNSKQETTIPMEFKFHSEKRILQPPTELFKKLSLTSQLYSKNGPLAKVPSHLSMPLKSSKENNSVLFQPEYKITPLVKETPPFAGNQIYLGNNGCISDSCNSPLTMRNLGVR